MSTMKRLLEVKRQPMALFANAKEAALAVPIPHQKAHRFIETIHNIPLMGLADKASYLKMGNQKVWATFRACHVTASILLSTVFKAMGKDAQGEDVDVENSQGLALLNNPNEWDSLEELLYTWVFHMKLTGEAYWHLDEIDAKGRPKHIYPLLPQYVFPVAEEMERITKFIYRINGRQIEYQPEEILYFRRPNPASLISGMGDIEPSRDLYTGFVGRNDYEKQFLKNGAMPSGVLTYEGSQEAPAELADIEDETWGEMKKWWQVEYSGASNAGKTVMLPGAWKYLRLGLTSSEMETLEREKWSVEQIFTNHGVPLSLAGIKDAANYACLPAGEMVTTLRGPVPIEELETGDEIVQFDPIEGAITVPVEAIIEQPEAEILEIKTDSRSLRASDNHPVLCVKRTGGTGRNGVRVEAELEYRRMDEISVGDMVVCLDSLPQGVGTIPLPVLDDREAAYALGQYLGDGSGASLTRSRIGGFTIATHETEGYQDTVADAFRKGFGFNPSKCRTSIRFNSAEFARNMVIAGLGGRSGEKSIPEWVFALPYALKMEFAAGLIDSDGHVAKRGSITFSVANRGLAEGFRHLLWSMGIPSCNLALCEQSTNYGEEKSYRFTLGILAENKKIPLRHPKKLDRLTKSETKGGKLGKGIPIAYKLPRGFTLPKGFGVQKVRAIKYLGKMLVYDLATIKNHNFIASGIVTHNTARLDEINFRKYEIVPLLDILVGKINSQGNRSLFQAFDPGQRLSYELSGLIDVEQTFLDYEGLVKMGGMTLNELREAMGLARDNDNPLLDGYYVDQSRIPLEMSGQDGPSQNALDAVQRSIGNPGKVERGRRNR